VRTVEAIANCAYVTGEITVNRGTIVLNRVTGVWQQTVRVTNTSSTDTLVNIGYVLDSLASGWTLVNGDGVTSQLAPLGSPYKNVASLGPGQSTTITLQFNRTGTLSFGYITRVLTGVSR
jgi:hypothetical protein